jgi:hypothetical protein
MGVSPPKTRHQRVTNASPNSGSCVADLSDYERGTNLSPCHTERETGVEMTESLAALCEIFLDHEVSPRNRLEAAEAVLAYESPDALPAGDRPMNSGHFHHIDIDSIMLDPTCGSGSAIRAAEPLGGEVCVPSIRRCPKRTGADRVEDMDVKLGKSSGVDAPRNKITFLAPRPSGVFYG